LTAGPWRDPRAQRPSQSWNLRFVGKQAITRPEPSREQGGQPRDAPRSRASRSEHNGGRDLPSRPGPA